MSLVHVETDEKIYLVIVAKPGVWKQHKDDILGCDCFIHRAYTTEKDAELAAELWNVQWGRPEEMAGVLSLSLCYLAK